MEGQCPPLHPPLQEGPRTAEADTWNTVLAHLGCVTLVEVTSTRAPESQFPFLKLETFLPT